MIPEKVTAAEKNNSQKEKSGSFALFDLEHFLRRILKNWYWFVLMFFIGYALAWGYTHYYAQNIYDEFKIQKVVLQNNNSFRLDMQLRRYFSTRGEYTRVVS